VGLVPDTAFPIRADDDRLSMLEVNQGSLSDLIDERVATPPGSGAGQHLSEPVVTFADLARLTWRYRQAREQ